MFPLFLSWLISTRTKWVGGIVPSLSSYSFRLAFSWLRKLDSAFLPTKARAPVNSDRFHLLGWLWSLPDNFRSIHESYSALSTACPVYSALIDIWLLCAWVLNSVKFYYCIFSFLSRSTFKPSPMPFVLSRVPVPRPYFHLSILCRVMLIQAFSRHCLYFQPPLILVSSLLSDCVILPPSVFLFIYQLFRFIM